MTFAEDRPARGYSWAPFAPGHKVNFRHGASDAATLSPIVEELRAAVTATAPWTTAPAFGPVLEAWCWAEARCVLYRRWFDAQGLWDGKGAPRKGLVEYERAEARAAHLRTELGLTPKSLVGILAQLATHQPEAMAGALDALKQAGAEIRQAAERRQVAAAEAEADRG